MNIAWTVVVIFGTACLASLFPIADSYDPERDSVGRDRTQYEKKHWND